MLGIVFHVLALPSYNGLNIIPGAVILGLVYNTGGGDDGNNLRLFVLDGIGNWMVVDGRIRYRPIDPGFAGASAG